MALREEAFLDTTKIETTTGVTYGVTRPTKSGPLNPTLASDGSVPDWGWGYCTWRLNPSTGKIEIIGTGFESPSIDYVHLVTADVDPDDLTWTRPNVGRISFAGNTNNNIISPGGYTRVQHQAFWDDHTDQWILLTQPGFPMSIEIRTVADPRAADWGTPVKTITDPAGSGSPYCEPMAFYRRPATNQAVILFQGITTGHASYGGLRRHVDMIVGPIDGSLTGTWTYAGRILTSTSDDKQYYDTSAWVEGGTLVVLAQIFDGTNSVPPVGTLDGSKNCIYKSILHTGDPNDGTVLTERDTAWTQTSGVYGEWDGGELIAGNQYVTIDNECRLPLPADGNTHHQSVESIRMVGEATWPRNRLGYITGTGTARTTLITAASAGEIEINSTGTVEVELLDASNAVIAGYARADCDAIPADTFGHTVTWNGSRVTPASFKIKVYLTSATVYHATAMEVDPLVAEGYGNTTSSGYGDATAEADQGSILVLPSSSAWEQVGTSIFVRTVNEPSTVEATITGTSGGLLRFRGADANLFDASLDGTTWASMVDIPPGTSTVHLRVTPEAPGTTLSAEIGVPV